MTNQTQTQSESSEESSVTTKQMAPYQTAAGKEVTHITLRITELDDGFRVTEPGVNLEVIEEDVHEAVSSYASLACENDA
jgi:hypothetical protein